MPEQPPQGLGSQDHGRRIHSGCGDASEGGTGLLDGEEATTMLGSGQCVIRAPDAKGNQSASSAEEAHTTMLGGEEETSLLNAHDSSRGEGKS